MKAQLAVADGVTPITSRDAESDAPRHAQALGSRMLITCLDLHPQGLGYRIPRRPAF